jgi:glycosyltransferase involved in cell wall biosynthesis
LNNRRIIYVLEPFAAPFGGVAVVYRHVEILVARGFSAFVHLPEKPPVDFYATSAPLLVGGFNLKSSDVLVIPEVLGWALQQFKSVPVRRLMFCQNHNHLPPVVTRSNALVEWGVDGVIASSEIIRSHLRGVYGLEPVPLLPCSIDTARFAPAPAKRRQIAFMPRKLPGDAVKIEADFKRSYPQYGDVPWVAIDGVTRAEAARVLGESAVFLSLSNRESLGLPPLEAMACDCLVAGYHGEGGLEFTTNQNGWWAEAGDTRACVDGLAAAFAALDQGGEPLERRRLAMSQTVARYSERHMEAELLAFWRAELG